MKSENSKSKRNPALLKPVYDEALELVRRSEVLKQTVDWQYKEIERLVDLYSEEAFEALAWDEKERHLQQCEEMAGRLEQSVKELKSLDTMYQAVREKVRKYFGRDVLPPLDGDVPGVIGPEDEIEMK